MDKRQIYFHEFNILTGNSIYFPFSSGLLRSFAETNKIIFDNYAFAPFIFIKDNINKILKKYHNPQVACFSSSIWNHEFNIYLARKIKEKFPFCKIIFGGPQITQSENIYQEFPFIDACIFGPGEQIFSQLLLNILDGKFIKHHTLSSLSDLEDFDLIPSPYYTGKFDYLFEEYPDLEFKSIIETNRNCPFNCAYCFWGQFNKRVTHHSLSYIKEEIEWIACHKVNYVFCADANFGMYKRDLEVAKIFNETKKRFNYPQKIRVCYGKNAPENVLKTVKILSSSNLIKSVTLSIQSNNSKSLESVNRKNIDHNTFSYFSREYNKINIPTYTELILGLPEETRQSFLDGIDFILNESNNQIFIYHCQVLKNTEMDSELYRKKYQIKTAKCVFAPNHGNFYNDINEYEEIIISTKTLSIDDWKYCACISFLIQLFYSLRVADKILVYFSKYLNIKPSEFLDYIYFSNLKEVTFFKEKINDIIAGNKRVQVRKKFGEIYWEPEELAFLEIAIRKMRFYENLKKEIKNFLKLRKVLFNNKEIEEILINQREEMPDYTKFPNLKIFATETVLFGRKGSFIVKK